MMKKNVSQVDGVVRITVALVIALVGYFELLPLGWMIILGIIGAILLVTGIIGYCPLYRILGICTYKKSPSDATQS